MNPLLRFSQSILFGICFAWTMVWARANPPVAQPIPASPRTTELNVADRLAITHLSGAILRDLQFLALLPQ